MRIQFGHRMSRHLPRKATATTVRYRVTATAILCPAGSEDQVQFPVARFPNAVGLMILARPVVSWYRKVAGHSSWWIGCS